jgi:Mg/Co/Ni transporter MgtE
LIAPSIGCFLEHICSENQQFIFRKLSFSDASFVFAEMHLCDSAAFLNKMRDNRPIMILKELEPGDAVDLLLNVEICDRERLLMKFQKISRRSFIVKLRYRFEIREIGHARMFDFIAINFLILLMGEATKVSREIKKWILTIAKTQCAFQFLVSGF